MRASFGAMASVHELLTLLSLHAATTPDMGEPIRGADYLLIEEAARHPELRGADLSCYRIYVYTEGGVRRVAFIEAR